MSERGEVEKFEADDNDLDDLLSDPRVVENENGTKTVTLGEPVEVRGKTISEVTFHPPRGRDLRETDKEKGDLGKAYRLAAAISKVPMAAFDLMSADDVVLCVTVAGSMGKKSPIGGTS